MPPVAVCCYVIEIYEYCSEKRRRDQIAGLCIVKQLKAQKCGQRRLARMSRAFGALFTSDQEDQIYTGD